MHKSNFNFTRFFRIITIALVLSFIFSQFFVKSEAQAAIGINRQINFQGKLVNNPASTNVSDTTYTVVFAFYDNASGGTQLWQETQSVTTVDGIFRVALGSVTPFPANFNFNWSGLYLGIEVNAPINDPEMTPRIQMAAVPFAFNAEKVAGLTVQDTSGNASTSGTLQVGNGKTISFSDNISFGTGTTGTISLGSSTNTLTLATTGNTSLTLPQSGTLCTTISCLTADPYWNQSLGALFPNNSTVDFFVGGQATTSAQFSLSGIARNQLTASVSGNLIVMANNGWGGQVGIGYNNPGTATLAVNGNVGIGTTTPATILHVSGTSSVIRFQATGGDSAQAALNLVGGGSNANWYIVTNDSSIGGAVDSLVFYKNAGNTGTKMVLNNAGNLGLGTISPIATLDVRGSSGTLAVASISGNTSFAALVANNDGVGDLFTASSSGTNKFSIARTGLITAPQYNTCTLKTDSTGLFTCGTDLQGGGGGYSPFQELAGAIVPNNSTVDFLIGGQSTAAAKFAVLGVASNQPIATIAGQFIVMPQNGWGGQVGIGTTAPLAGSVLEVRNNQNNSTISRIYNSTNGVNASSALILGNNVQSSGAVIQYNASSNSTLGGAQYLNILNNGGIALLRGSIATNNVIIDITTTNTIGIGTTTSPISQLQVTRPLDWGLTGKALAIFDQIENQDILTASSGGTTKFILSNEGYGAFGATSLPVNTELYAYSTTQDVDLVLAKQSGASTNLKAGSSDGMVGTTSNHSFALITNNTRKLSVDTSGKVGVNTPFNTFLSTLDVRRNTTDGGTISVASVSGKTSYAAFVVDNSLGDIFTASASGATRFVIAQNGTVTIGNSTDGLVFSPVSGGPTYSGAARPTKKITLNAEYPGAILTASGSGTTTGSMTSDASASAGLSNFINYYEWSSSTASPLQDYTIAVRVKLPEDFSAWATATSAAQIKFNTELSSVNNSKMDVLIYNADKTLSAADQATPVVYRQAQTSNINRTWNNIDIDSTLLDSGAARDLDAAGDEMVIYLKLYSMNDTHVQVGDIVLSYLSKF